MNSEEIKRNIEQLRENYSCSQSTLMGLCENCDLNQEQLAILGSGFSGGIGGTFDEGTCGALTGAIIALGFLEDNPESVKKHSKELYEIFKDEYGSVECGVISKNGEDKSPCVDCCLFIAEKAIDLLD